MGRIVSYNVILGGVLIGYFLFFFPTRWAGYCLAILLAYRLFKDVAGPPEGVPLFLFDRSTLPERRRRRRP